MTLAAFILGAYAFGWLLPELVFLHSQRTGRVPVMVNLWCAFAFALLGYGVRG